MRKNEKTINAKIKPKKKTQARLQKKNVHKNGKGGPRQEAQKEAKGPDRLIKRRAQCPAKDHFMKRLLICAIQFYSRNVTPYKLPCCKYYPTCSEYAVEAIKKQGVITGSLKALCRLLRCNPFSKGGYDPA